MTARERPSRTTDQLRDTADGRQSAPSAERNLQPIVEALRPILGHASGSVLEIGSGTGQHAAALAATFPDLEWQPSEDAGASLVSIRAWVARSALSNLREPIRINAAAPWPDLGPLAAVLSINVIHIAPWAVARGIVEGAGIAVVPGGSLIFYGPFKEDGRHIGEGNRRFDEALRAQNPSWGVRDLADLSALAHDAGFGSPAITEMPVNNRLIRYQRL